MQYFLFPKQKKLKWIRFQNTPMSWVSLTLSYILESRERRNKILPQSFTELELEHRKYSQAPAQAARTAQWLNEISGRHTFRQHLYSLHGLQTPAEALSKCYARQAKKYA